MALAKPPKSSIDRRAEALIDKASAVHSSKGMDGAAKKAGVEVPVTVRIPKPMLSDIESLSNPAHQNRAPYLAHGSHLRKVEARDQRTRMTDRLCPAAPVIETALPRAGLRVPPEFFST